MAQRKLDYRTNGSAAIDPAYLPWQETAARPLPEQQPEKAPKRRSRPAPKQRQVMAVAPLAVIGLALAGAMLVLVLFGYAQVYVSACEVGALEQQVQQLQEENRQLKNQYDTSINLSQIEARARELGMRQPTEAQTIQLHIPAQDVTVVTEQSADGFFASAWQAILNTARELWEYLR